MITLASLYLLRQVERCRARANDLLLNMLPASIAARLKDNPEAIADTLLAGISSAEIIARI
jgi:hypothetical protein